MYIQPVLSWEQYAHFMLKYGADCSLTIGIWSACLTVALHFHCNSSTFLPHNASICGIMSYLRGYKNK